MQMHEPSQRIPTLDGCRGVAILLVLFDHFQAVILGGYFGAWSQTGYAGVTIFFVLSGYLITGKLLEKPQLRTFYLRRVFRLMPAAWFYLVFLAVCGLLVHFPTLTLRESIACLLFYRNALGHAGIGMTEHFWSLSIEEQFYLLWPALLLFAGKQKGIALAVAAGALSLCFCVVLQVSRFSTIANIPALLIGCSLAMLGMRVPTVPVLSSTPLAWIGRISYSIYIWNFLCFSAWRHGLGPAVFIIPVLSFYFIEKPGMRLGDHLRRKGRSRQTLLAAPLESLQHSEPG